MRSQLSGLTVRRAAMSGVVLASVVSLSMARQPEAAPAKVQTMLVAERVSLDAMIVSPKDAGLEKALGFIPARLLELRDQVPELAEVPPEIIRILSMLADRSARVAVTNKGFDQQTGMPGIGAIVSFKCVDEADARSIDSGVTALRERAAMPFQPSPSKRFKGMTDLPLAMALGLMCKPVLVTLPFALLLAISS